MSEAMVEERNERTKRKRPNILITGTPGVGKTATASNLARHLGFEHINVGELANQYSCYEGRDEELDTNVLDEDKLLDIMEPLVDKAGQQGQGIVADFHVCEIFPERWFDLVLVLRASTEVLFDRLSARGYNERKRTENMDSEIMQVVLEEARASYALEIVHEVPSNTVEDMQSNIQRVEQWCEQWMANNK